MPIFFQQDIDECTRLAIWKIEEEESFFNIPLQREITHPHKRQQHLAGRYLLQYLFPDFPLSLIKVADTRKPFLEDEAYHFSISHCSNYAAAIVSKNKRVGVDIEVPTKKVERIKHKFLHTDELAMESNADVSRPCIESRHAESSTGLTETNNLLNGNYKLTLLWSAKEAVFKWWSFGGVDFSEMIRLQPFELQPSGKFNGIFHSTNKQWPLTIEYRLFNQLCLAWVVC